MLAVEVNRPFTLFALRRLALLQQCRHIAPGSRTDVALANLVRS
jgi:hypothetical protein